MSAKPEPVSSVRGVWFAPWTGPRGEDVAFSIDAAGHLVHPPTIVPFSADRRAFADAFWEALDAADPEHIGEAGDVRFRRAPRPAPVTPRPETMRLVR